MSRISLLVDAWHPRFTSDDARSEPTSARWVESGDSLPPACASSASSAWKSFRSSRRRSRSIVSNCSSSSRVSFSTVPFVVVMICPFSVLRKSIFLTLQNHFTKIAHLSALAIRKAGQQAPDLRLAGMLGQQAIEPAHLLFQGFRIEQRVVAMKCSLAEAFRQRRERRVDEFPRAVGRQPTRRSERTLAVVVGQGLDLDPGVPDHGAQEILQCQIRRIRRGGDAAQPELAFLGGLTADLCQFRGRQLLEIQHGGALRFAPE